MALESVTGADRKPGQFLDPREQPNCRSAVLSQNAGGTGGAVDLIVSADDDTNALG